MGQVLSIVLPCLVLGYALFLAVRWFHMRKQGGCGSCGCSGCPLAGNCSKQSCGLAPTEECKKEEKKIHE